MHASAHDVPPPEPPEAEPVPIDRFRAAAADTIGPPPAAPIDDEASDRPAPEATTMAQPAPATPQPMPPGGTQMTAAPMSPHVPPIAPAPPTMAVPAPGPAVAPAPPPAGPTAPAPAAPMAPVPAPAPFVPAPASAHASAVPAGPHPMAPAPAIGTTPASTTIAKQEPAPVPGAAPEPAPAVVHVRRGPTPFAIAFGLGALVMVGGVAFAAGRMTADDEGGRVTTAGAVTAPGDGRGFGAGAGGGGDAGGGGNAGGEALAGAAAAGGFAATDDTLDARTQQRAGFGSERQRPDGFGRGDGQRPEGFSEQRQRPEGFGSERQRPDGFGGSAPAEGVGGDPATEPGDDPATEGFTIIGEQVGDSEITQADDPAQPPDGAPVGPGGRGFGGFGGGGIGGVVTGIGDLGITLESSEGVELLFTVDETTGFASETPIDPADIASGDLVRVAFPTPTIIDGEVVEADGSDVATTITLLPPGTQLGGGGRGQGGRGGGQAADGQGPGGQRGQGGRGGFRGAIVQGNVTGFDGTDLTVELPSGESRTVTTDAATAWIAQTTTDASALDVGDDVRVQVARGGFGGGSGAAPTDEPRHAVLITFVEVPRA